jgi:adenosylmethionine-8-amino-7-oxononanoate aminotransferase
MAATTSTERFQFTAQAPGPMIVGGDGVWLHTADGRSILDGAAGALVCNVGHGRRDVAEAIAQAVGTVDYVLPTWTTPNRLALVDAVVERWLPEGHHHAFFASGGSEANDSAIRLARLHHLANGDNGRWKVIGRSPSFHGSTLTTLAAGQHGVRRTGFEPLMPEWPKAPWDDARAVAAVIEAAGPETVAAFIGEPVIGAAGGALTAGPDYWAEVAEICRHYGVLTIVDEVMTGVGRTGHRWAHEADGWRPDILVTGKGLAGGYQPISMVSAADHVVDPVTASGKVLMFFTYSAHDTTCAAALAVLGIVEREGLVERSATLGTTLRTHLDATLGSHPAVTSIRGRGLMQGIGLRTGITAAQVVDACLARDVWIYPCSSGHAVGDAVMIGPPLVVEEEHLDRIVTTLTEVLDSLG